MAQLVVIGLSHHTAPVEVREKVALDGAALDGALRRAATDPGAGEAMIVSTCNRVEVYLVADEAGAAREGVTRLLAEAAGVEPGVLAPHLYAHDGDAAAHHLFRVAASLDSMVVGEPQILGQVKEAYDAAVRAGTGGALLARVVPRAFAAAKRVRTETEVARASTSVAAAAVELGRHIFGELDGKDVLLVGAGEMAQLAAKHLASAGCRRLVVVNRTASRGEELARAVGGEARPWEELEALLGRVDIVLCSTGAPRPVVDREMVARAMRARRGRWLCFIDIAVPRDVEAEVGQIENVYLYDVDELEQLVDEHLADRRREAARAEAILVEELGRLQAAERSLGVVPTIRALRERFLAVAHAEAERSLGRLSASASDADRREVSALAEAIVNKLLHAPLTALKRESDVEGLAGATRTLFGLADDGASRSTPEAAVSPPPETAALPRDATAARGKRR